MTEPYGTKGCRCWPENTPAYGLPSERWMPNAYCPHHGLFADYTERKDTGTYKVITGPCERHPGASTIGGLCAMCSRTPDAVLAGTPPTGCTCSVNEPDPCRYCAAVTEALSLVKEDNYPGDCAWGPTFHCRVHCPPDPEACGLTGPHDHVPDQDGSPVCIPDRSVPIMTTEQERGVLATVKRLFGRR